MKTFMMTKEAVQRKWWVVDAGDVSLGRLAAKVAPILMGKTQPTYTPYVDCGDFVIVINADKVRLSGAKPEQKQYDYYTQYPGGHKYRSFAEMLEKKPEKVIELAVRRMLPKNKLGRKMILRLKAYRGPQHEHQAQQPEKLELS